MSESIRHLGIDVSKALLDLHLNGKCWQLPNNPKGFSRLVSHLKKHPARVVCEASGPYHLPLVLALQKTGLEVCVINPRQVRDFAKSRGILAKTDCLDARVLTLYGDINTPRATAALPAQQLELAAWAHRRQQLVCQVTAETNRTEPLLPTCVKKQIEVHLRFLKKQIAQVENKIKELLTNSPELSQKVKVLESVDGVGLTTAVTVLAALPELGSLNRAQVAALTGTAPLCRDSGTLKGKRVTWGGRGKVRNALYMAALTASRCNPVLKAVYQRLRLNGKSHKVALTALMRKLVIHLNSLLKLHQPALP